MVEALSIVIVIVLVLCSGLFSGLTLGLMGLDLTGLEIVISGGTPQNREYAKQIKPIRKNGNLLLCTLLLGNVAVNAGLSIVMADMTDGLIGFLSSTIVIVIFGEIVPQALCSRHPLWIGAHTTTLVRIIRFLLFPMVYPLAKALDHILGKEMGTLYTKSEMKKLVELHSQAPGIEQDERHIMEGALAYGQKEVCEIMTPIKSAYMLEVHRQLDFEVLAEIFKSGYSRIPIYDKTLPHESVVGLLLVKDLILLDPADATPLRTIIDFYGREVPKVFPDTNLKTLLNTFKSGKSHLAMVIDVNNDGPGDPYYYNVGLVTLEDVIEDILQDKIADEYDEELGNVAAGGRKKFDMATLRSLGRQLPHRITPQEVSAIFFHLSGTVDLFHPQERLLSEHTLKNLIATSTIDEIEVKEGEEERAEHWIYKRGEPTDYFTLILDGKVRILAGRSSFVSELGRWSVLAVEALEDLNLGTQLEPNANPPPVDKLPQFVPDFSAQVVESSRLLRLSRTAYYAAVIAQRQEEVAGKRPRAASNPKSLSNRVESFSLRDFNAQASVRRTPVQKPIEEKQDNGASVSTIGLDIAPTPEHSPRSKQAMEGDDVPLQELQSAASSVDDLRNAQLALIRKMRDNNSSNQ